MTIIRALNRPFGIPLIKWAGDIAEVHLYMGTTTAAVLASGQCDMYDDGSTLANVGDYIFPAAGFVIDEVYFQSQYQPLPTGVPAYAFTEDLPVPVAQAHRVKAINLPAVALLGTTIPVAWDTPMPSADYSVTITPSSATTVVGGYDYGVMSGSITNIGCKVFVKPRLLALSLGAVTLSLRADSN